MKNKLSFLLLSLVLFFQSEAMASEAIALWAITDAASISDISYIGIVAYHSSGINRVEFTVNDQVSPGIFKETLNPATKEYEFVFELNSADYSEDEWLTIGATVYPNDGEANVLPNRRLVVRNLNIHSSWFVDETGEDSNSGNETAPFKTLQKALNSASGGDDIFLGNGSFHLPASWDKNFDKYVTIKQWPGAMGFINSSKTIVKGMLKVEGIFFDFSSASPGANIIKNSTTAHLWFDDCTFKGLGKENFSNQQVVVRCNYDAEHVTFENCTIDGTNRAFVIQGKGSHIVRNNTIRNLASDVFNPASNVLISGNDITGIQAPSLFVENLNSAPFDLSLDKDLSIHLCSSSNSCDSASYDIYTIADLAGLAANPASVELSELVAALNADANFFAKCWAEERYGKLRIHSRTTNYVQQMWISGSTRDILGFSEINVSTQAEGAGAHSDILQYWGSKGVQDTIQNLIFRNNKSYDNRSQGIFLGENTRSINIAIVNNLVDRVGKTSWNVMFDTSPDEGEKFYNLMFVYNTIWDGGTCFDERADRSSEDMFIKNNIYGRRYMGLGDDEGWDSGNNFYYWYHWKEPSLDESSIIIKTTLTAPIDIFENVVYDPETQDDSGDFNLVSNSPPRDKADNTPGIIYDIDWNLRDQLTDMGAFEYRYLGDTILYQTLCAGDSLYFGGQWISESSTRVFTDTIPAFDGGDSILVLKLEFLPQIEDVWLEEKICQGDSLFLQNEWQHAAGIYSDTLFTENGCMNIIITDLSLSSINADVLHNAEENTLLSLSYGDQYRWKDCNTNEVLGTDSIFIYEHSGEYCLEITKGECMAESEYQNVVLSRIAFKSMSGIKVFPNPADEILTISLAQEEDVYIKLIRIDGAVLMNKEFFQTSNIELDIARLTSGLYIVEIYNNSKTATYSFIKK